MSGKLRVLERVALPCDTGRVRSGGMTGLNLVVASTNLSGRDHQMEEFLRQFPPWAILAIAGIVAGTWIVLDVITAWRQVREKQAFAALAEELLRQGRPVEEVERLLQVTSDPERPLQDDEQALVELAEQLTCQGVSAPALSEIMATARAADSTTRHAVSRAVAAMSEHGPTEEQVLAVVRGLCRPPGAIVRSDSLSQPLEMMNVGERGV